MGISGLSRFGNIRYRVQYCNYKVYNQCHEGDLWPSLVFAIAESQSLFPHSTDSLTIHCNEFSCKTPFLLSK